MELRGRDVSAEKASSSMGTGLGCPTRLASLQVITFRGEASKVAVSVLKPW